jgi:hypothetical protein
MTDRNRSDELGIISTLPGPSGLDTGLDLPAERVCLATIPLREKCHPPVSVPQSVPGHFCNSAKYWSEWQDLNLRPPRPERGGLPGYFAS